MRNTISKWSQKGSKNGQLAGRHVLVGSVAAALFLRMSRLIRYFLLTSASVSLLLLALTKYMASTQNTMRAWSRLGLKCGRLRGYRGLCGSVLVFVF